jgi:hypothetical protein
MELGGFSMKPLLLPLVFFCWFWSLNSIASTRPASECTDFHTRYGSFHFQRLSTHDGSCLLNIDPFDVGNFKYRGYLVSSEGMLMVFNSYNATDDSDSTGARIFHFFPRINTPDVASLDNESLVQTATPGLKLVLSQEKARILRMIGADIKEDPVVQSGNQGGVEIKKSQFLYLDSGFMLGGDVTSLPDRISTFHDSKGRTCSVQNRELFNYTSDGDTSLKFNDAKLKVFLKSRCPKILPGF